MMINEELLKILACPQCKKGVFLEDNYIVCRSCKIKFPVVDGIPIMLLDEAKPYEGNKSEKD